MPSAAQYQAESRDYFVKKQKARVLRADPPRRLQNGPREVDAFSLEVEVSGQKVAMDYYVLRQAAGGATAAVRISAKDPVATRQEAERIVRSATCRHRRSDFSQIEDAGEPLEHRPQTAQPPAADPPFGRSTRPFAGHSRRPVRGDSY